MANNLYRLSQIDTTPATLIPTGYPGLDKLLGGGILQGSTIILSGMPGAGKSTLLLQTAEKLANSAHKLVLYLNAEETKEQVKERAKRLNLNSDLIFLADDPELNQLIATIKSFKPDLVIIDSLQMLYSSLMRFAPGTPTQMKNSLLTLCQLAKNLNITIIFVGHATKGGFIAGLQTLQHMVDVVLYLGFDEGTNNRFLKANKNRFGSTDFIWQLKMGQFGLIDGDSLSSTDTKVTIVYDLPKPKPNFLSYLKLLRN